MRHGGGSRAVLLTIVMLIACAAVASGSEPAAAATAPKPGTPCKKLGATRLANARKFTCVKRAGRLVWNNGARVAAPPTPTPSPTPSPTLDLTTVTLQWVIAPTLLPDPGVFVDPAPTALQDGGLNTSLVVLASVDGAPRAGVPVRWAISDASGYLESFATTSGADGLARAWLIAGNDDTMAVTAKVVGGTSSTIELRRLAPVHSTLTRPVIAGFWPPANAEVASFEITATLDTAPMSTYYALASFANFYTGFQSINCSFTWDMYDKVCAADRGAFLGREAHFSVWDGKARDGSTLHPKLVAASDAAKCRAFDHEGNGLMCLIAFDWSPTDLVRLRLDKLPGAAQEYDRLRVSAQVMPAGTELVLAVIDVPAGVRLGAEFIAFNENWELNASASCLAAPKRSFTIRSIRYLTTDGRSLRPSSGYMLANVVAAEQSLCMNYRVAETSGGLTVQSGGDAGWPQFAAGLAAGSQRFSDTNQATLLRRDLTAGELAALQ